eukprot:7235325-Lingulodinium_polyedra.AAC.1
MAAAEGQRNAEFLEEVERASKALEEGFGKGEYELNGTKTVRVAKLFGEGARVETYKFMQGRAG